MPWGTGKQGQAGCLVKNTRQATGQGKTQGDGQRQEDHGEYPFAESEPKWSDRSPLNSGSSPAGQLIGDSTLTRSCAPTAQWETMHKRILEQMNNHPARIWQHEVKRREKRQRSKMYLRRSGCGMPAPVWKASARAPRRGATVKVDSHPTAQRELAFIDFRVRRRQG